MKKACIRVWLVFAFVALSPLVSADVLTMPGEDKPAPAPQPQPLDQPATDSSSRTVPGRGMTMEQVEARFGDPKTKIPAVGDPPITRWDYGSYTVYFERNIVLDTVIHH